MQRARRTLEGTQARQEKPRLLDLHRNAQRLLRSLFILNPYAKKLTFLDDKTRTRRDHEKYLSLIDSITFLHQYQRPIKNALEYNNETGKYEEEPHVMVTLEDIELANKLANEVLGRSLDELPPQTRRLLMIIDEMVNRDCEKQKVERVEYRFSRRQVREYCKWGNTQIKMHFKRLEDMEYLAIHRGKRGLTFDYELLYDGKGKDGKLFLMGLIDVDKLRSKVLESSAKEKKEKKDKKYEYDANRSGIEEKKSVPSRPQVGAKSGGCRVVQEPLKNKVLPCFLEKS
jgi:hypothetical protein